MRRWLSDNDARSQKVNVTSLAFERFEIAFLQGDQRMMAEQIRSGTTDAQYEMYLLADQALVEAYQGRFRIARTLWAKAVDVAEPPQMALTAYILGDQALVEALVGNYGLAWQQAEKALALRTGSADGSIAAVALHYQEMFGRLGRTARKINNGSLVIRPSSGIGFRNPSSGDRHKPKPPSRCDQCIEERESL